MNIMKNFGVRLKEFMKENELNSTELANAIGINRSNISKYLNGVTLPNYDTLLSLVNFFDCSADYLLGLTEIYTENVSFRIVSEPFYKRLRYDIKYCNSSQYALEKSKAFSKSQIYNWINGKTLPSTENLIKLAKKLKCSVDFLLGRTD